MYKLLLCWRYLRTRYIALASVISVMLGVATMIVVNSVMAGFSYEMQSRLQGILSDVIVNAHGLEGFRDPAAHMEEIRQVAGDDIVGMTPTVQTLAMLNFQHHGRWFTREVTLIGVDEETHAGVSDFGKHLQHPGNRERLTFNLRENGYTAVTSDGARRQQLETAGWMHRRIWSRAIEPEDRVGPPLSIGPTQSPAPSDGPARVPTPEFREPMPDVSMYESGADADNGTDESSKSRSDPAPDGENQPAEDKPIADPFAERQFVNPFARTQSASSVFNPSTEQHTGLVLGIALSSFRDQDGNDRFLVVPGDDVKITFPTAGTPPKAVSTTCTVVDLYESKMSEYDSKLVFVPIRKLQEMRGMVDPSTGVGFASSIQIKLREGADANAVRDKLQAAFPAHQGYMVSTWRDMQGPLLSAVEMETAVLNILLFMIIAVAGFGILAIFFMIVVEKTRDIGILKSLGASGRGIMSIFLTYGLSLGIVGSGAGLAIGLLIVKNINHIRDYVEWSTGKPVFDPSVYYFYKIPTIVNPVTVVWIVAGAMAIAVAASVVPAMRAARLHPVEALRYE